MAIAVSDNARVPLLLLFLALIISNNCELMNQCLDLFIWLLLKSIAISDCHMLTLYRSH